jgi:hypothetical protein
MCDLAGDVAEDLFPGATKVIECEGPANNLRGDLLVCDAHAAKLSRNIGRVEGEVRCSSCGYFRPIGTPCGEPCL